jgi:hypothetical protein
MLNTGNTRTATEGQITSQSPTTRQMSSYSEHACDTAAALRAAGGRSWSGGKPVLEFDVAELIDRARLLQDAALVSIREEVHQ